MQSCMIPLYHAILPGVIHKRHISRKMVVNVLMGRVAELIQGKRKTAASVNTTHSEDCIYHMGGQFTAEARSLSVMYYRRSLVRTG